MAILPEFPLIYSNKNSKNENSQFSQKAQIAISQFRK